MIITQQLDWNSPIESYTLQSYLKGMENEKEKKKSEKNVVLFFSSWLERVNERILVGPRSTEMFLPKKYWGERC